MGFQHSVCSLASFVFSSFSVRPPRLKRFVFFIFAPTNTYSPPSTPQRDKVQLLTASCIYWSLEVLFISPLSLLRISPPCLGFFFFLALVFLHFFPRYVRETEVEQASKWMAKPPFPLLTLLFMHVIPVPAPSSPPPHTNLCLSLSLVFYLFILLLIYLFFPNPPHINTSNFKTYFWI